jgi:hypothetical protein
MNSNGYRFQEAGLDDADADADADAGADAGAVADADAAAGPPTEAARLARAHGVDARHWSEFAPAKLPRRRRSGASAAAAPASAYSPAQRAHRLRAMQAELERKMDALKKLHADDALAPAAAAAAAAQLADEAEAAAGLPAGEQRQTPAQMQQEQQRSAAD